MHAMQDSYMTISRIDMLRPPAERARAVGQPLEVEDGQPAVSEHPAHLQTRVSQRQQASASPWQPVTPTPTPTPTSLAHARACALHTCRAWVGELAWKISRAHTKIICDAGRLALGSTTMF